MVKRYKTKKVDGKRLYVHRVVAEVSLGRSLTSEEIVHHINGNRHDNRIENLAVMSRGEHAVIHKPWSGRALSWDIEKAVELRRSGYGFRRIASMVGASSPRNVRQTLIARGFEPGKTHWSRMRETGKFWNGRKPPEHSSD